MNEAEKLSIAKTAIRKGYDYEQLGEYLYGSSNDSQYIDDIWDYIVECEEMGTIAFTKEYGEI